MGIVVALRLRHTEYAYYYPFSFALNRPMC